MIMFTSIMNKSYRKIINNAHTYDAYNNDLFRIQKEVHIILLYFFKKFLVLMNPMLIIYIYNVYTGCAKKKERHFKYICKVANNLYSFIKIRLLTHNYICGQMSKYQVCTLNIH